MSLLTKIRMIVALVWLLIVSTIIAQSYFLILNNYLELERKDVASINQRSKEAIDRVVESLFVFSNDWAHWTDTYEFLKRKYQRFIDENLNPLAVYHDSKINYILFYDNDSKYYEGRAYDIQTNELIKVPNELLQELAKYPALFKHDHIKRYTSGLINYNGQPVVIASEPITTSDQTATPNGNIIMGFKLDEDRINELARTLQTTLAYIKIQSTQLDDGVKQVISDLQSGSEYKIDIINNKELYIYSFIKDINGNPIGLLRTLMPRSTYQLGLQSVRQSISVDIIAGIIILLLLEFLLKRIILNRLFKFKNQLNEITNHCNFDKQITVDGNDEIAELVKSSNEMLHVINLSYTQLTSLIFDISAINKQLHDQIEARKIAEEKLVDLNNQLIIASRRAGMTDIATNILHNVGNTLNSVNISAGIIDEKINKSKLDDIKLIADMINQHQHDLATYLKNDAKGKILPEYIAALADKWHQDKITLSKEISELTKNIDHIKSIIKSQQAMCSIISVDETVNISQLIDDAISFCKSDYVSRNIKIIKDFSNIPYATLDKVKFLQIMVNVFKNAIESLSVSEQVDKKIHISLHEIDSTFYQIKVIDNGTGISGDVINKIFTYGFTTKEDGHGFGLHTSALAAQDLGGTLIASSDGLDQGATFVLTLPYQLIKNKQGTRHGTPTTADIVS